jgi:3-hydroxy-D-aspartate aldolase
MRLYIFVDADYGRNRSAFKAFEPSLFVWATVTSRPTEDRVIVVAGLKTLPPSIRGRRWFAASPPRPTSASDEHGRLGTSGRHQPARPRRHDPADPRPTIDLYDWYICVRGNRLEQLWLITARGAGY